MLEDGLSVIASELPTRTRWLLGGYRNVAIAHLLLGQTDAAITAFNQALAITEANPKTRYVRVFCLGLLALAHTDLDDWARAEHYTREAEELLVDLERSVELLPVLVARATVLAHGGDLRGGSEAVAEAIKMMRSAFAAPYLLAEMSLRCAQAAHDIGNGEAADVLLRDCEQACLRLGDPGTIPTRATALHDRLAGIDPQVAFLTPSEERVLRQLATHRTLQEIAEHLHVGRQTVKSHVSSIYAKLGVSSRAEAVARLGHGFAQTLERQGPPSIGPARS